MQHVEFLNYPDIERPLDLQWGVRIDGRDLRAHAADATRGLWRLESEDEDEGPAEEERFLLAQHGGLSVSEIGDPVRHFLGDRAPSFADPAAGTTPVLGCSCGIWGCWPLLAVITAAPDTVTWSSFRQPFRKEWGELAIGPFTFDRPAYEATLTGPTLLTSDPLRTLDGTLP
ncbi:hypothetical protein ABZT04_07125 [Streptomyces sp. NPDC005492]|uniref:hypothetical protein n=1 Tax=Streptomyces sp. NPDC005492 TaxID=3156883 RepID=UPI0033BFACD6